MEPITRSRFFKLWIKIFALTTLSLKGINCGPNLPTPKLRGISQRQYHNMRALQEVFLKDSPLPDFDLGLAFDAYVFGHPTPIDTWPILQELVDLPGSPLMSLVLHFSFTPLAACDVAEREKRLLALKTSSLGLKRGAYAIMRQLSFYLLSQDKSYQKYVGYEV